MIVRTGIDLAEIHRLKEINPKIRKRFLERVFTPQEILECGDSNEALAGRFAVKEAVVKALGTGIGLVSWKDVETVSGPWGEPVLNLHGKARQVANLLGLTEWSVSITDTGDLAAAVAVAFGDSNAPKGSSIIGGKESGIKV